MSEEPSIHNQLNYIIEYLNYYRPLFIKLPSDREFNDKNGGPVA
ncbi:MAG: hypothetical protein ACFFB2_02850 [Promethearchaeota archaeon]